jgi:hypothetical protein
VLQVTEASYRTFLLVRFYKQKKKVQERQENVTEESEEQSKTVKNLIKITVLQLVNDLFGIVMFISSDAVEETDTTQFITQLSTALFVNHILLDSLIYKLIIRVIFPSRAGPNSASKLKGKGSGPIVRLRDLIRSTNASSSIGQSTTVGAGSDTTTVLAGTPRVVAIQ